MSAPSVWSTRLLSYPAVAVSEWPWIPIGLGVAAIMLSRKGRRVGGWLGLIGVLAGLRPLWQLAPTVRRNEAAMREGLGADFDMPPSADKSNSASRSTRRPLDFRGHLRQRRATFAGVRVQNDVLFQQIDGRDLRADIYQPQPDDDSQRMTAYPAVIAIHGGSWRGGDKGEFYIAHNRWLAQQGYVVVDIQYRLSPEFLWPAQLIDVKTAIRWLRAHADQYAVDPDRIVLLGRSAGAHLALVAAFTPNDPAYPPSNDLPQRDDVQGVIAIYAPTDLSLLQESAVISLSYWMGSTFAHKPDVYLNASPMYVVTLDAPPVLLAHGGADNIVTPENSARMYRRLRDLGIPAVLLYYPWSRHGFDFSLSGLGGQMLQHDTDRFLAWLTQRQIKKEIT